MSKDFFYGLFNKKSEDKDTNKETTLPIETEQPKTTYTTQTTKNNTLSETGYKLTDSNIINGEIDEVFSQGRIGDCMFLSTLISFTHTQEGRDIIKNAITVNKDENGEIASGVIAATLPRDFSIMSIKIFGFNTDAQKAAEFAFGAYVIDGKNTAYIQEGEKLAGDKYVFTSYNKVFSKEEE